MRRSPLRPAAAGAGRSRLHALALLAALAACEPAVEGLDAGASDGAVRLPDAGAPTSCERPLELCGAACVNTATDPLNCGACGMSCPSSSFCSGGACVRICSGGLTACGASCVDPSVDHEHCGGCDQACAADRECRGGACRCPEMTTDCNGRCINTDNDRDNCGICGRACRPDQACNHGSCDCATGTRETECGDGRDDDCDDLVDCDDPDCGGATRSCMGRCGTGVQTCSGGRWGACEGGNGEAEICGDGIDQDCNGADLRNPDEWEPNDSCDDCVQIQGTDPNGTIDARFDSVDDPVDCYKFVASDDTAYPEHIRLTLEQIPAGHDYDLYLYRNLADCRSRTALASSAALSNARETIDWSESFGSSDDGTYYVRVVRFSGASCTADYRLVVNGLD